MIYKVKSDPYELNKNKKQTATRGFNNSDFNNSYKAWVKRKTKYHKLTNKEDIKKAVDTIFRIASDLIVEKDGGVVLEGIGYFAFFMPIKRRFKEYIFPNGRKAPPKYKTQYYQFLLEMFTDVFPQNNLRGWYISNAINKGLKKRYSKDNRYRKLYYKEVKKIYKGR